ncbi:ice-binding family protein [Penaeicola halotolerans]|uniref:ice-binding family protein n=1 Tax=Penaeicola halotolerans TaxID=2793196 RepID=UPI001CF8D8A6|nr:ice-binding family protein [Penaeicola halotolerans]
MKTQFTKIMMLLVLSTSMLFTACKDDEDNDTNAPNVASTTPDSNDTNVERNATISFTFDEDMAASTLAGNTFTLRQGNTNVAGTLVYEDRTATFTPTQSLAAAALYTATVNVSAKNIAGVPLAESYSWTFTTGGNAAAIQPVDLGTSGNYVILAKTAITNSPTSAITGNVALSPAATSYITGFDLVDDISFATSSQVVGRVYAADMSTPTPSNLTTAVDNMNTAYNNAADRTSPDFVEIHAGDLGGKTLVPGVYKWTNNVIIPTNMTLSGSATDVWIFQIAGNLTMSAATSITLSGGANVENIFWQVAGEVTIRTTAQMKGVILSKTGITLETGAGLDGRALAQTAVILDANVVKIP